MEASARPKRSNRKKQGKHLHALRQEGSDETEVLFREYGDVDASQSAAKALKIAFEDIKEKYLKSQADNKVLREKLEMGFKAYDDKYKELENLKHELDLKEDPGDPKCDASTSTSIEDVKTDLGQTNEKSFRTTSTQTLEEKTDEVVLTNIDYQNMLKACGLEIISETDKVTLMLTNRDNLKCWLENETDGKVNVVFEQKPVCERFIQTDDVTDFGVNPEQEAMIIKLKSKIADQAGVINKYRQTMEHLMKEITKEPVVKEETSTKTAKKILQVFQRYHHTVLIRCQTAGKHIMSLKKELEFQQNYCKHLLGVIKNSPAPNQLLLTISHPKLHGLRAIKKPPKSLGIEEGSGGAPQNNSKGPLSMPVQVSDEQQLYTNDDDSNTEEESSASVIVLQESRLSNSETSGLPLTKSKEQPSSSHARKSFAGNLSRTLAPVASPRRDLNRSLSPPGATIGTSDVTSQDEGIEVIIEENMAIGGTSRTSIGAKECPICYAKFPSYYSQAEFEVHVGGHFRD